MIMSGPMPDEKIYDLIRKEKSKVQKGLKLGDEFIDEEGRRVMKISDLDEFTKTQLPHESFRVAF